MLDSSLKDYWVTVRYYRICGAERRATMLNGYLPLLARTHKSPNVRRLLTAFVAREKETIDGNQSP